jgi:hypothetical protein
MKLVACPATGLIIDAFGELRDQLEQVKEDMEVMYCIILSHFAFVSSQSLAAR